MRVQIDDFKNHRLNDRLINLEATMENTVKMLDGLSKSTAMDDVLARLSNLEVAMREMKASEPIPSPVGNESSIVSFPAPVYRRRK